MKSERREHIYCQIYSFAQILPVFSVPSVKSIRNYGDISRMNAAAGMSRTLGPAAFTWAQQRTASPLFIITGTARILAASMRYTVILFQICWYWISFCYPLSYKLNEVAVMSNKKVMFGISYQIVKFTNIVHKLFSLNLFVKYRLSYF